MAEIEAALGIGVEQPDNEASGVERLVMPAEAKTLARHHAYEGQYAKDCKETQLGIANRDPLYKFGDKQTKEDWLKSAKWYEEKQKYHESRVEFWRR